MISKLPPWLDRNREWVGMDVDIGDGGSLPDSEGEGDIGEQEDGNRRSMNPDLEDNTGIEKPPEAEDSDKQNLSENTAKGNQENPLDPESSHVFVDEEVDFDQFGAPPPDLPVVDDSERKQDKGYGSPDGGSSSTDVEKPKDHVADTDLKNSNDESSLIDTEGKEQRDPKPDVGPSPADDEERDSNTEPTAEERALASDLQVLIEHPELRQVIQAGPGGSLLEKMYRRAKELDQMTLEQAERIGDLQAQVDSSNTQLEENIRIREELTRKLEAEHEERLKSEEKLMELQELVPNMEEKLKNSTGQVQFLEAHLQEQAKVQKELENDVQEKTQLHTQLKALSEQVHLQEVQLQEQASSRRKLEDDWKEKTKQLEERTQSHDEIAKRLDEEQDARFTSEANVLVLREMFSNAEEKLKDLHDHVDSLAEQLEQETELKSSVEEKMKDLRDQVDSLEEQLEKETELRSSVEEKMKDLRDQVDSLEKQLQKETELRSSVEEEMKDLRDQVDSLEGQLQKETESRSSVEEKLKWKERQHTLAIEEHSRILDELLQRIEELKSETHLKEEKVKDLHNQVGSLTAQLQEQEELKKELEGKGDNERALLPVSSMPWSDEKLEFEKLLDAQKSLYANQVQEAEKLRTEAEKKVGLLNHQVQNLQVFTDIAETLEHVFSAKDRAVRQALWTAFQALCVGVAVISFIATCRDPSRSCLAPT